MENSWKLSSLCSLSFYFSNSFKTTSGLGCLNPVIALWLMASVWLCVGHRAWRRPALSLVLNVYILRAEQIPACPANLYGGCGHS